MAPTPKKPLIPGRVAVIGEEGIPRHIVELLDDAHLQIFLREPDPQNWPPELQPMVAFLPAGERLGWVVAEVMDRHEQALGEAMQPVLRDVCASLAEISPDVRQNSERIVDEMLKSVGRLLLEQIRRTSGV